MASSVIGALRVNLGLDSAQFIKGTNQAQGVMSKFSVKMVAVGAAITAAIGGAAIEMVKLARSTINTADEISKAAQSIGIGTEELSRLRYAAALSGVSFEQLQTGVGRLSRNMLDASRGLAAPARAFAQLGIEVKNSDGTLRTATEVMGDVAERFSSMEDGAEKTALAMEIFGRAGASLIPMFNGGRDGLRELTEEADRFGVVIDAETGRKAELFNDNLTRLQGAFAALATRIAADMLPHLIQFTEWLLRNQDQLIKSVQSLADFAVGVGKMAAGVARGVAWMEERFGSLARSIGFAIGPLNTLVNLATRLGSAGGAPVNSINVTSNAMLNMSLQALNTAKAMNALGPVANDTGKELARGVGGGASTASAALKKVADDGEDMARRVNALFDRLFPKIAEARKLSEELAMIDASGRSEEEIRAARLRRVQEGQDRAPVSDSLLRTGPIVDVAKEAGDAIDELQDKAQTQTVRIARTFADMAQGITSSLQQLANGIRGGGFLDILGGVLNLFTQLGGAGVFGSTLQGRLNAPIPGFANGTNFAPGGLAVVGERGPELVNLRRGSQVIPNHKLGGGHITVGIDPRNGNVTAFVNGQIAATAPAVANAGAMQAQAMGARSARRTVRR